MSDLARRYVDIHASHPKHNDTPHDVINAQRVVHSSLLNHLNAHIITPTHETVPAAFARFSFKVVIV